MSEYPLFIVASERSGTNLLRKRITESQSVYFGPSPAHLLKNLYFQEPYFGDLTEDANFALLLQKALDLATVHFSPWSVSWTKESLLEAYDLPERNAISVMHFMMTKYAQENGYERYICKDNYLYEFALQIADAIPTARFIYLYRDPRDFVLSQMARPAALRTPTRFATLWQYEQTRAIAVCSTLKQQGRCIWVSYEDFIEAESTWVKRILGFLEVAPSTKKSGWDASKDTVQEWENLDKPTMRNNKNKFKKEMRTRHINIVEAVCGLQMEYLGYMPYGSGQHRPPGRLYAFLEITVALLAKKLKKNVKVKEAVTDRQKVLKSLLLNYRKDS